MILKRLSIVNYKNIEQADLMLSPKLNCFTGRNGMGKTNLLDAVYYLSFCKSATVAIDSQVIKHDCDYCVVQGHYLDETGETEDIFCGMKRGQRKQVKRGGKPYARYSEHVGLVPLVIVSPADSELLSGGSDERRRFMDITIAQYDKPYLEQLNRYNKALEQRNVMLRGEEEPDPDILSLWEEIMADAGTVVHERRRRFVDELSPIFHDLYAEIAGQAETVSLSYVSQCGPTDMLDLLRSGRAKERILGYSIHGIHKDDLTFDLDGFPLRREGSQGQNKTCLIALKLAQYFFLRRTSYTTPLLLLDDIFDRLDATRVEQIVHLVAGDRFGQIFITDVNRGNMDLILATAGSDYRLFAVDEGTIGEYR